MSKQRYILIDNDTLIHQMWKMAAQKAGVDLQLFYSFDECLKNLSQFKTTDHFYIDSELDNEKFGEIESQKLFDSGFKELYLATGRVDIEITNFPWLKKVVSKRPPF